MLIILNITKCVESSKRALPTLACSRMLFFFLCPQIPTKLPITYIPISASKSFIFQNGLLPYEPNILVPISLSLTAVPPVQNHSVPLPTLFPLLHKWDNL